MEVNSFKRFGFLQMRLLYSIGYSFGIFWLIDKTPFLSIKEPYNKWYQRDKK